ncbi:hypothetical protein [Actinomadura sp. WMMB 499]|uniref:hypothetical protein n=1 Tax=Actinomadura sp. WMMB 499 TaxID=1219491 RepID=UPI00159E2D0A|nr:hypothetical protein [Actinomadura sp. WMMB 499]
MLRHVFGKPGSVLPPYEVLTEPQQPAMRTLAEMGDDTWCWGNFTSSLWVLGV